MKRKLNIMTAQMELIERNRLIAGTVISCLFGTLFLAIGIVNTFWGNDTGYGIFIILLSFVFFPPFATWGRKWFGFSNTLIAVGKVLLALFILWSSLGVGELFDKVDMMLTDMQ